MEKHIKITVGRWGTYIQHWFWNMELPNGRTYMTASWKDTPEEAVEAAKTFLRTKKAELLELASQFDSQVTIEIETERREPCAEGTSEQSKA